MENIFANLLIADNLVIQQKLQEAFNNPAAIGTFCYSAVSKKESQICQQAKVLLRKRFEKQQWDLLKAKEQNDVKHRILSTIIGTEYESVHNIVAQFVNVIVKYEFPKKDEWTNDVLKIIADICGSADAAQREMGWSVFAILTGFSLNQFLPNLDIICVMFSDALMANNHSDMFKSTVFSHMVHFVPIILGHSVAERTFEEAIPINVKILRELSVQQPDEFVKVFEFLKNMAEYTPKLLTSNLLLLIDFCIELANNSKLNDSVRVCVLSYIVLLVQKNKNFILNQHIFEPIGEVVLNLMATFSATGNENRHNYAEYFVGSNKSNLRTAATRSMKLFALQKELLPPLKAVIASAVQSNDPLQQKAAYLSMVVIAEYRGKLCCASCYRPWFDFIKVGILKGKSMIKNVALFGLCKFSELLQQDVIQFASDILPILIELLNELCTPTNSADKEPIHFDRIFDALKFCCLNLKDAIVEQPLPGNAEHTGSTSIPFVEPYSEAANKPDENLKNNIRNVAIKALTKFMLTLNKNYIAINMRSELAIGQSLLDHTDNWFESLFPLYFEGIKDRRKEIRQISVIGLHMLWTGDKSYKKLPTILEALCTAMLQEKHAKTLFEMCRVLMFVIFCDSDCLYIPMTDLVPVFECFHLLIKLENEKLLIILDKLILAGVFVMHMYQPPMQPTHKNDKPHSVIIFLNDVRARFSDNFNKVLADQDPEVAEFITDLDL